MGLAPAAAALLAARDRFDGGVLGPLSDYVSTGREDAELAERLLGDWMHAVLVRDGATVDAVQEWHAEAAAGRAGPAPAGPRPASRRRRSPRRMTVCRVEGPAAGWVRAALAGSEVLDPSGRVLRRASGAIFLSGAAAPSGPLRRRAELAIAGARTSSGRKPRWPPPKPRWRKPSAASPSGSRRSPKPCRPSEQAREAERQAAAGTGGRRPPGRQPDP